MMKYVEMKNVWDSNPSLTQYPILALRNFIPKKLFIPTTVQQTDAWKIVLCEKL